MHAGLQFSCRRSFIEIQLAERSHRRSFERPPLAMKLRVERSACLQVYLSAVIKKLLNQQLAHNVCFFFQKYAMQSSDIFSLKTWQDNASSKYTKQTRIPLE